MTTMPTNLPSAAPPLRSRGPLLLIALLFLGPFVAATLLYFAFPQWAPQTRVNHGELLQPPPALPELALRDEHEAPVADGIWRGHWTLLQIAPAACDDTCLETVATLRRVHIRLNRDRERLQQWFLAADAQRLDTARDGARRRGDDVAVFWCADAGAAMRELQQQLAVQAGDVYLVDPHGNAVLRYRGDIDPAQLYADLRKLLGLSTIG